MLGGHAGEKEGDRDNWGHGKKLRFVVDPGERKGQEAVNALYPLRRGAFFFKADVKAPSPGEPLDVTSYLLEAARVRDEAGTATKSF